MHWSLAFLTPLAALVALAAIVPLAALALGERRSRAARRVLGLPAPERARRLPRIVALVAVPALLAVAAAQPVLRTHGTSRTRVDADVYFVFDVSRSMLAAPGPAGRTRLERAKSFALALRAALPDVPAGVATLTDRVLPDLFPDADLSVFTSTVERAVAIEQPPPADVNVTATSFDALAALGTANYFGPESRKRLVVVLTDGESRPFDARRIAAAFAAGPGTHLELVRVAAAGEAVYDGGRLEHGYRENPGSVQLLASLASATGGAVVGEGNLAGAIHTARADLGSGPTVAVARSQRAHSLAPLAALLAIVPLLALVPPGVGRARAASARA